MKMTPVQHAGYKRGRRARAGAFQEGGKVRRHRCGNRPGGSENPGQQHGITQDVCKDGVGVSRHACVRTPEGDTPGGSGAKTQVERQANDQMQARPGEAGNQRDARDRVACLESIQPRGSGKRAVIQPATHPEADDCPRDEKSGRGVRDAEQAKAQRKKTRLVAASTGLPPCRSIARPMVGPASAKSTRAKENAAKTVGGKIWRSAAMAGASTAGR